MLAKNITSDNFLYLVEKMKILNPACLCIISMFHIYVPIQIQSQTLS